MTTKYLLLAAAAALVPTAAWAAEGDAQETLESAGTGVRKPATSLMTTGPIALGGAKFLQIQENGLPTLEFGDIGLATADQFLRADLRLDYDIRRIDFEYDAPVSEGLQL